MTLKRSKTLDVFRGLLFVLMSNTHALSLVGTSPSHWLLSDMWLPNGWATVVYVVLSGYGIGWIFSVRHAPATYAPRLRHRSGVILAVMLLSNILFTAIKLALDGDISPIFQADWWIGFVTLASPWSISGVLLPTALVLLCAPTMIRLCRTWPWQTLAGLLLAHLAANIAGHVLGTSAYAANWAVRVFLSEGLGGFPVLPFVLSGCMGCWFGIQRHRNETVWLVCIALLLLLQLGVYASSFAPPSDYASIFRSMLGPVGKFTWLFLCAGMLARSGFKPLVLPLALIGKFALTTFVMHRVFLQALSTSMDGLGLNTLPTELRYATLWIGTLVLTWAMCVWLQRRHNQAAALRSFAPTVLEADRYFTR
jgi:hypothetical protein